MSEANEQSTRPSGINFARAFVNAYDTVRASFADREEWSRHFSNPDLFTSLILRNGSKQPEESEDRQPALAQVAKQLGLDYIDGEPLRLDAVFARKPHWAPMTVAIEHENDSKGFDKEVQKLMSVRCSLKVGITYTPYRASDNRKNLLENICHRKIKPHWDRMCLGLGPEPRDTEYLFIVGHEERAKELKWYFKSFCVSDGYDAGFTPI